MSQTVATAISRDFLRQRAAEHLHRDAVAKAVASETAPIAPPSDFDLNPQALHELQTKPLERPAAVLVPIIARTELTVLFTERPVHLPVHAGQISFPGGKFEGTDDSFQETALREAEEEVGLKRTLVEPLGFLDAYQTGTGYRITPLVALVDASFRPLPNKDEVASVFEVPLHFLMNPNNHKRHQRSINNTLRTYYAMPFEGRYIWGATAGILKNMHTRLFAS